MFLGVGGGGVKLAMMGNIRNQMTWIWSRFQFIFFYFRFWFEITLSSVILILISIHIFDDFEIFVSSKNHKIILKYVNNFFYASCILRCVYSKGDNGLRVPMIIK